MNIKKELNYLIQKLKDLSVKEKILIVIIITGIFFRFHNLAFYLHTDENIIAISSLKFFHEGFLKGLLYVSEHPPIARIVMGLTTIFTPSEYISLKYIGPNMYIHDYIAIEAIKDNYLQIRLLNALFGSLTILIIFLIGKDVKDTTAGLIAAAISSVSFNLITYSKLILMEAFFTLTFVLTILFFIKYLKKPTKKRLALMSFSLLLCLGSRQLQPLLLIPTLLISYYVLNKRKGLIKFSIALIIPALILFLIIYPPVIFLFALGQFGTQMVNKSIGSTILELMNIIFLRYSLLMTFTIVSFLCLLFFKVKKTKGSLEINRKKIEITPITVFFTTYLILLPLTFLLTRHNIEERYTIIFVPLISLVFSFYSEKIIKNKVLYYPLIALSLLNIFSLVMINDFPTEYGYHEIDVTSLNQLFISNVVGPTETVIKLMEENNSLILTNDVNLLIFYNNSLGIPLPNSYYCKPGFIKMADYLFIRGQINAFNKYTGEKVYLLCQELEAFNNTVYTNIFQDFNYTLIKVT
jgi:hypothetical protein